jgi:hypothetical protein
MFDILLTDNFQYQSQFIDTDNIIWRDQMENVQDTDKL